MGPDSIAMQGIEGSSLNFEGDVIEMLLLVLYELIIIIF